FAIVDGDESNYFTCRDRHCAVTADVEVSCYTVNHMRVLLKALFVPTLLASGALAQSTVPVSVTTSFVGLYYNTDNTTSNLGTTFNWITGSAHSLSLLSPQYSCGNKFVFTGWSNGGGLNTTFTTPSSAANIVANFDIYYQLRMTPVPSTGGTVSVNIT